MLTGKTELSKRNENYSKGMATPHFYFIPIKADCWILPILYISMGIEHKLRKQRLNSNSIHLGANSGTPSQIEELNKLKALLNNTV